MEINGPRAWTLAVLGTKRLSKCMRMVESGITLDNMAWCRHHISVGNSDDQEGSQWFMSAFDCCVRLEGFIIWVGEPPSFIHLIRPFLTVIKKLCLTTKPRALGFQKDAWSCGFQSLHITNVVVDHRVLFRCAPHPNGFQFCGLCISVVNSDRVVRVIELPGDDWEGVTQLTCPPDSPKSTQCPTPKGVVSLGMVLRVRLLEVGGSTGGALGKAFFPFTCFCGTVGGGGGALGKALFPFSFCCGKGAVGGGCAKRSTFESDDSTFFSSPRYPGERPKED